MEIQRGRNFRQIPNDKSIAADVIVSTENKSPYVSNRPNFHLFSVLARLIVIRIRCRNARNPFGTHNACWCTIQNRKLVICRQLSCSSLFSFFFGSGRRKEKKRERPLFDENSLMFRNRIEISVYSVYWC